MLILTRRIGRPIIIGDKDPISVTVVGLQGYQVKLGIKAPEGTSIYREEVYQRIQTEKQQGLKNEKDKKEKTRVYSKSL
jgi:carbon storage regulator